MKENDNYKKPIKPWVDIFVQDNFPFIAQDFDSLTLYEKYQRIIHYLNEVIKKANLTSDEVAKLTALINSIQDYVNNYFENLDVQEAVNNKIDDLISDGTLSTILNQQLLNTKLDTKDIYEEEDNFFIGTFSSENIDKPNYVRFYITKDLKTLSPISYLPLVIGNDKLGMLYAPSSHMIFKNNKFYLLSAHDAGKGSVKLFVSEDLKNWDEHSYDLLPTMEEVAENWAPKWFEDSDGTLYITLSIRDNKASPSEIQKQYIAKINSLDPFDFNNAQPLKLPFPLSTNLGSCYDGFLIKNQETYYFYQRRQNAGDENNYDHIEYYKGNSLDNLTYMGIVNCFNNIKSAEAPFVIQDNTGKFFIFADFTGTGSGTFYATSADLENWSNALPLNTSILTRHGGFCKISSEVAKKFLLKTSTTANYFDLIHNGTHYIDIENCIKNGVFYPLAIPNMTYYVDQDKQVEINSIDNSNMEYINYFNIVLWGENSHSNAKLTIRSSLVFPLNRSPIIFEGWEFLKCPITFYNSGRRTWLIDYNIYHKFLKNRYYYQLSNKNPVNINKYLDSNNHIQNLPLYNGIVYTCNYSASVTEITVDSYQPEDFIANVPYDIYFLMYSDQEANKLTLAKSDYLIPDSVGNSKTFSGNTDGNKFIHYSMPIATNYLQLRRTI